VPSCSVSEHTRPAGGSASPSTKRSAGRCAFVLSILAAGIPAWGGTFQVSPVRATLSTSRSIAALTVKNHGAEPAVVQLEVVTWSQHEGKDVYVATKEIIATPPIFTVPPGGTQVVRVGLRRAPDPQRELAYRLYLQEVPPAPGAGFQGLQVALRLGVPVFVNPRAAVAPALKWSARRGAGAELKIGLANSGYVHVQVSELKVSSARGETLASQPAVGYVLPGQSREWGIKVSPLPSGAALRLVAQTDAGEVKVDLVVE